jgi:hypothetical protein
MQQRRRGLGSEGGRGGEGRGEKAGGEGMLIAPREGGNCIEPTDRD